MDVTEDPPVSLSEVGSGGPRSEEVINNSASASTPNLLLNMETLLTRMLTVPQPQATPASGIATQLVKFDPDSAEADVEGWCNVTEIIVNSRQLEGAELLLVLTHALRGRAATCLTKLQLSQLTWPQIKELLIAKFSKPMLPQDYFDEILRFQIGIKETAYEAAMRL
ncbi:uncharacterized protein [Choristoneura fumiferana]|uniref:uncharacterized protein n=1 Tax=Choristoneura fumiferana TaxID=7141 RepID=UPI003D15E865